MRPPSERTILQSDVPHLSQATPHQKRVRSLATRLCCAGKNLLRSPDWGKIGAFGGSLRMPDTKPTAPLDLSMFDNLDPPPGQALSVPAVAQPPVAVDPRLVAELAPERLVELPQLSPAGLAAAPPSAPKGDFPHTPQLLAHGEG